ncbi:MAG: histidine kinase N-terminal domain-containing protein [Mobilicoccus sp.]|nr:histidine kinase N-terminal domain-containing protein [Mobilicoccus sp.]
MPSVSSVVERTGLSARDVEWLRLLVGDWQLVSDLSFADLVLWVKEQDASSVRWTCAAHVRPNTGPLVFHDDMVDTVAGPARARLLVQCLAEGRLVADEQPGWFEDMPIREEAVPVMRDGTCVAVLTRHSNLVSMRTPSRLEVTYRSTADALLGMVATGHFPQRGAPTAMRRGAPRVGDGMVRLDTDGVVTYASPNAISALHRLGGTGRILGDTLSRIVTDCLEDRSVVDEFLPLVLVGKAPWRTEVEGTGAALALRSLPLSDNGRRIGALVLVRDVSELRRREQELLTKDATIREIHHRVKNNLQTVAALLRLQSRRVDDVHARAALGEAERRVATIALVHETLSRTLDEAVDFDEIVSRTLTSMVEVAGRRDGVTWHVEGRFGQVSAEDANSLAMVVSELIHNAVEHGIADREHGRMTLRVRREESVDQVRLHVDVEDDGAGLPEQFRPGASGLGTKIVSALVQDLRGTIAWSSPPEGGTRASFEARLRPLPGADDDEDEE